MCTCIRVVHNGDEDGHEEDGIGGTLAGSASDASLLSRRQVQVVCSTMRLSKQSVALLVCFARRSTLSRVLSMFTAFIEMHMLTPISFQVPSRPCLRSEYCIFRLCCHRSLRHIKSLSTICPRMGQAHSSLARYNISLAIYGLSWISIPCLTILVAIPGSYSAGPDRCCFLLWYVKFSPSNGPLPPLP